MISRVFLAEAITDHGFVYTSERITASNIYRAAKIATSLANERRRARRKHPTALVVKLRYVSESSSK